MNYDLLLQYLSEVGSGTWNQFRQAVDHLADEDDDIYHSVIARHLSALGHVEFAFNSDLQWAVCPPTFAWLLRQDHLTAVLCGLRTEPIVADLQHHVRPMGCFVESKPQMEGPDAIFITVPSSNVGRELAVQVGANNELQAAERIAHCLPTLADYARLYHEVPEPIGYKMKIFNLALSRWIETEKSTEPGLYRYDYYRPEYRLKLNGRCLKATRNVGLFLLLQHHNSSVLAYDRDRRTLTVPVHPRLPLLYARAATLCSGLLPYFDKTSYTYTYQQITPTVAHYIMSKLDQEVQQR